MGYPAPDLTVIKPDLQPIQLTDLRGKAVLLNFWASWCGPCQVEMPEIQRLSRALPDGAAILAVNVTAQESSPDAPASYLAQHGYTFPVALDPTGQAGAHFGVLSLPTSLFISPGGIVTARIAGPLSYRAMLDYLVAAAAARTDRPGQPGPLNQPWLQRLNPGAYLPGSLAVGPAVLPTHGLFWLGGAVLAHWLAGRRQDGSATGQGPARPAVAEAAQNTVVNLAVGGLLGAKLVYLLLDPLAYVGSPGLLLTFPYGPLALPAGLLGGIALAAPKARKHPAPLLLWDAVAPALVAGAALAAAGSPGPLFPLLLLASLVALRRGAPPGRTGSLAVAAAAVAVTLADLALPAATAGGITGVQVGAVLITSGLWYWQTRWHRL